MIYLKKKQFYISFTLFYKCAIPSSAYGVFVWVICVEWDDAVYGKHEYLLRVNRKELRKINTPAVR